MVYSRLKEIGLSKTSIACYKALFDDGAMTANELKLKLNKPSSTIYFCLSQLRLKGFIRLTNTSLGPTYYSAVLIDEALEEFAEYYKIEFGQLARQQRQQRRRRRGDC